MDKKPQSKFSQYVKMPEIRLSVYFLLLFIGIGIINIIALPSYWATISIVFFITLTIIIFSSIVSLGRLNFKSRVEHNELKSIIVNLYDSIIAYDNDFQVSIFNREAERIFEIKAEDVVGKKITPESMKDPRLMKICQVLYPSLAPLAIKKSETGIYPQVMDITFIDPKLVLRITTDRIIDADGFVVGFVKVIHNKTREEEILKSKSEFIEVAAHQLRTPLTSINWIFESLVKEELSASSKEMVDMGLSAVASVLRTVNDLLDVSQIEEGKFGYKLEDTELVPFIEDVLGDLMPFAQENGIKLYLKKPDVFMPKVYIDQQKLGIALSNLVSNGIKYNLKDGEVVVEIKRIENAPFAQISVKDTGIGIPAENIKNMFTKFFRGDNAQKIKTEGSGLGLYISKNIIKRHGGEIWVESQLNRGTTIFFTLPLDKTLVPTIETPFGEE